MSNEIEQAFDEWLERHNSACRLSWRESDLVKNAFTAGVEYATKRHIKDIEPIKEK